MWNFEGRGGRGRGHGGRGFEHGGRGFEGRGGRGHGPSGRGHGHRDPGFRSEAIGGRMFGHGDLKMVVLALLEIKPGYGYELIKAIEERSLGHYVPSPGVIYPTLSYLVDMGHATANPDESRKLYTITPEGIAALDENRVLVQELLDKLGTVGSKLSKMREFFGSEQERDELRHRGHSPLREAMHQLRHELMEHSQAPETKIKSIVKILERTIAEIRGLDKEPAE